MSVKIFEEGRDNSAAKSLDLETAIGPIQDAGKRDWG